MPKRRQSVTCEVESSQVTGWRRLVFTSIDQPQGQNLQTWKMGLSCKIVTHQSGYLGMSWRGRQREFVKRSRASVCLFLLSRQSQQSDTGSNHPVKRKQGGDWLALVIINISKYITDQPPVEQKRSHLMGIVFLVVTRTSVLIIKILCFNAGFLC